METSWRQTARFAFRQSLGVLFGYVFLGTAFGILLRQAGFGALWSLAFSGLVYAGSLQFVLAGFLAAPTALPTVASSVTVTGAGVSCLSSDCRQSETAHAEKANARERTIAINIKPIEIFFISSSRALTSFFYIISQ